MEKSKTDRGIKLTGLWKGEAKNGVTFMAGSIGPSLRLLIFENGFRKRPTDPDYIAYLAPQQPRQATSPSAGPDQVEPNNPS